MSAGLKLRLVRIKRFLCESFLNELQNKHSLFSSAEVGRVTPHENNNANSTYRLSVIYFTDHSSTTFNMPSTGILYCAFTYDSYILTVRSTFWQLFILNISSMKNSAFSDIVTCLSAGKK